MSSITTSTRKDEKLASSVAVDLTTAWWRDYAALTKPRITLMVLLTVAVAMFAAQQMVGHFVTWWVWIHTIIATAMIAGSASTINQWYEHDRDLLMPRTQKRPLPSGRLTRFEAAAFGWLLFLGGSLYLAIAVNWTSMVCGMITWTIYCWVYTPIKTLSWWNTAIGTLPGALPVMIGWTAVGGSIWDWQGWALMLIVVLWQFPHFMAIAWLYREQYARAGFRMLTKEEPTGVAAGWHAVLGSLALIPLSVIVLSPVSVTTWIIALLGVLSCVVQAVAAFRFLRNRDNLNAKKLLKASLIYLPAIMLLVVFRWAVN